MAELVAITYGKALFEVAQDSNSVDLFREQMDFIKGLFEKEPDFYELYKSPRINKDEKKKILREVFGDKVSDIVLNFLFVLMDKKRTSSFFSICKEYFRLTNEYNNIEEGTVYSAVSLSESQVKLLEEKLSQITGKSVRLQVIEDPSLIGGIKVKIGEKVIDASIQNKLKSLKETIDLIIV
ncbi:MAG: F0F1 ATP synthase subunit delta [Clostridiales bacterium]|nr:F0F1 ATP synthase subunit delta [Clostridiales bacterium]